MERAEVLMAEMDLLSFADQKFANLSQGQKQRTLLARSLINHPDLLILDEPCAGLDLTASERFLSQVSRLARAGNKPTLIMVTHRPDEIVPGFSHGLLLHQGRVLAAGSLDRVMTDTLLSRTFEIDLKVWRQGARWAVEPRG